MKDVVEKNIWEEIFSTRSWGKYPNEELVTFVGRRLRMLPTESLGRVLEVGCGPGANLWFLGRVSEEVVGIDFSQTALDQACFLYSQMNDKLLHNAPKLRTVCADITNREEEPERFDYVFDVLASTHNTLENVAKIVNNIHSMLAVHGTYWGKFWGIGCPGFSSSVSLGQYSRDKIAEGPCQGVGVTTFVDKAVIRELFSKFESVAITKTRVEDEYENLLYETYVVIAKK